MANSRDVRSALAQAYLNIVPPTILGTLVGEPDFIEKYGISVSTEITFNEFGVSIETSKLFNAVRKVFVDNSEIEVSDTEFQIWKLNIDKNNIEQLNLSNSNGDEISLCSEFAMLSQDKSIRLNALRTIESNFNLSIKSKSDWRKIISKRSLQDHEVGIFIDDVHDTPAYVEQSIRRKFASRQICISSLVPPSRRYFERLIGVYDGSSCISEYAVGTGREFFEFLVDWQPTNGLLFCFLLSSHCALTAQMNVENLEREELVRAFEYVVSNGDRISQLGAIEIGLRICSGRPELETCIINLIQKIKEEGDSPSGGFKLLLELFCFVDGELSRLRMFTNEPPFYRRLAALTQASLIARQILIMGADINQFCERVCHTRGVWFYIQNCVDIRIDALWHPEFAQIEQIRTEFFSRVFFTAKRYEENIKNEELSKLIFSEDSWELDTSEGLPKLCLPGLLDTNVDSLEVLPHELLKNIEAQLRSKIVTPSSFTMLVICAITFQIPPILVELAVNALKHGNHRFRNVENKQQLLTILRGLATVSAVTRSKLLADELRITVRRYLCDVEFTLSTKESFLICLNTAASRLEPNAWREFVGEWLTELAFSDMDIEESELFLFHLYCLMDVVPELWITCGRAEAALRAYTES